ncbi:UbiA prenyltransferase family-domain-containing protein [Mycena galopus ATCC 62051]|nr:UbiA prenyltransferase family-domain-containing protein [Mycena galopus ATCC 62051]
MPPFPAFPSCAGLEEAIRHNIFTLYLFSKTDIKTTIAPITMLAICCAPVCEMRRTDNIVQTIFWLWLQVLHFNLVNQSSAASIAEDLKNKPFRPLPSQRITLEQALILRYVCLFVGLSLSATFSLTVFLLNIAFVVSIIVYHNFHGDGHWLSKNVLNALGYGFLEGGATLIAGCDRHHFGSLSRLSIILSVAIIATTVHAQDFQDQIGDKAVGRRTLPIVFPILSRYLTFFGIISWSFALSLIWNLDFVTQTAVVLLGTAVAARYLALRTVGDDKYSYILYNVRSSFILVLYLLI